MSSISTEIFGRLAGSSTASGILAGKRGDGAKSADAAANPNPNPNPNPLLALLSSGPDEDDDDHTYDASGRSSGSVRMSAASAAGIEDIGDGGWFGDENGNPLPVKLEVRIGDKVVARVYEGGGTVIANGFNLSALKIGPLSEGLESTMTEDELTDFRMAQVMKFFSNMGATFETSPGGHDKGAGSNAGDSPSGIMGNARFGGADEEEASSGGEEKDASERTIIPQGMTLAEVLALSNQDYIAALEREKRRVAELSPEEQGSSGSAQAAIAGEDGWFATQQSKAGEALAILQETQS